MRMRFWVYLIVKTIVVAMFAAISALVTFPDLLKYLPERPYDVFFVFNSVWLFMVLLSKIIELRFKKIDRFDKATLKRYKVIDWIVLGFICIFFVPILAYEVRSWFP